MPKIDYNNLLEFAKPGDCFYYQGNKEFIHLATALQEPASITLIGKLKQCWNILWKR